MLIECRYYDIDLEMTKQMEKELAEEEDALTEMEKSEEQKESAKMYEEIVRKGEEHKRKYKKIPDADKVDQFVQLQKAALLMAKMAGMNITVMKMDDDTYGYIELAYNHCWFIQEMPRSCFTTMAALYEKAHSIYTETQDDKVLQKFDFILTDEVKVE